MSFVESEYKRLKEKLKELQIEFYPTGYSLAVKDIGWWCNETLTANNVTMSDKFYSLFNEYLMCLIRNCK